MKKMDDSYLSGFCIFFDCEVIILDLSGFIFNKNRRDKINGS